MASLDSIQTLVLDLSKVVKSLQKEVHRIRQRLEDPSGEKAKARSENNSFKHPQVVSDDLKKFLGLGPNETISRSDVTKRIFAYAKEKGLNNGKIINIDASLRVLMNPPDGVDITVTNLQKYINHHYIKKDSVLPPDDTPVKVPATKGKPKVAKS